MNADKRTTWLGLGFGFLIYIVHGLITNDWSDPTVITTSTAIAAIGKSAAGESSDLK